jgi:hypothetical protein
LLKDFRKMAMGSKRNWDLEHLQLQVSLKERARGKSFSMLRLEKRYGKKQINSFSNIRNLACLSGQSQVATCCQGQWNLSVARTAGWAKVNDGTSISLHGHFAQVTYLNNFIFVSQMTMWVNLNLIETAVGKVLWQETACKAFWNKLKIKPASFIVEQNLSRTWLLNNLIPFSHVIVNID